jgi:hypothetical protein
LLDLGCLELAQSIEKTNVFVGENKIIAVQTKIFLIFTLLFVSKKRETICWNQFEARHSEIGTEIFEILSLKEKNLVDN